MVKIKQKKQLNLPQLIEWALKNGIKNKHYVSENRYIVTFDKIGFLENSTLPLDETFTVEVEEEITEYTLIPKIVSIGRKKENEINIHHYCRISQFIDNKDFNYYVLNDDDTLTLIWCDGKLIKE